jgi:hypothetical protein
MIFACCKKGDITKLRLWISLGVNVLFSALPLISAAASGQIDVMRYLVKELGADVNRAKPLAVTALSISALGNVDT